MCHNPLNYVNCVCFSGLILVPSLVSFVKKKMSEFFLLKRVHTHFPLLYLRSVQKLCMEILAPCPAFSHNSKAFKLPQKKHYFCIIILTENTHLPQVYLRVIHWLLILSSPFCRSLSILIFPFSCGHTLKVLETSLPQAGTKINLERSCFPPAP